MEETKKFRYQNADEYKQALKQAPNETWLDERNIGSKVIKYLPIYIIEMMADEIYTHWEVVDEKHTVLLNEIAVTVKISATPDYPDAQPILFTGTGVKPIQMDSGMPADTFPKGKKLNALEYCLPGARGNAISNAFSTLGNIFGRNIGRKVSNDFAFVKKEVDNG